MAKRFPIIPAKPELICWGCDKYCPADAMACGNGSDRTQHPVELFGEDWMAFGLDAKEAEEPADTSGTSGPNADQPLAISTTLP